MSEKNIQLIQELDKHLDAVRTFQYKFYEGVRNTSDRLSTTLYSSFLSISTLGIVFITKNENSNAIPLVLFVLVILINILKVVFLHSKISVKREAFLKMIRPLEIP